MIDARATRLSEPRPSSNPTLSLLHPTSSNLHSLISSIITMLTLIYTVLALFALTFAQQTVGNGLDLLATAGADSQLLQQITQGGLSDIGDAVQSPLSAYSDASGVSEPVAPSVLALLVSPSRHGADRTDLSVYLNLLVPVVWYPPRSLAPPCQCFRQACD